MEFDGTGGFLARYAHGDRVDQPLSMTRGGQEYYVQADHQGSVIRVTDSVGAVVNSYEYDAYGQRLSATEGVEIAYGYTGREYDAESELMYYRARTYDPTTGRFLQTDPLGFAAGDLNLYRYVGNDPVNFTDPSGMFSTKTCASFPWLCIIDIIVRDAFRDRAGACGNPGTGPTTDNIPLPPPIVYNEKSEDAPSNADPDADKRTEKVDERRTPGADGADSKHIIEQVDGETTSVTHQVTKDGQVIHQHQTHIGKDGSEQQFPNDWINYPDVGQ